MRVRIIIDTEDANEPEAISTNTPFSLNVCKDDDDGTQSVQPLNVHPESTLIGNDIAQMLDELSMAWGEAGVFDQLGKPMPRTGEQWREAATALTPLSEEQALPECPRHGGSWGSDETCQMCVDVIGNMRPTPDICDECDQLATQFWPSLDKPVQLCDSCTHDAFRSGWEPGV